VSIIVRPFPASAGLKPSRTGALFVAEIVFSRRIKVDGLTFLCQRVVYQFRTPVVRYRECSNSQSKTAPFISFITLCSRRAIVTIWDFALGLRTRISSRRRVVCFTGPERLHCQQVSQVHLRQDAESSLAIGAGNSS